MMKQLYSEKRPILDKIWYFKHSKEKYFEDLEYFVYIKLFENQWYEMS